MAGGVGVSKSQFNSRRPQPLRVRCNNCKVVAEVNRQLWNDDVKMLHRGQLGCDVGILERVTARPTKWVNEEPTINPDAEWRRWKRDSPSEAKRDRAIGGGNFYYGVSRLTPKEPDDNKGRADEAQLRAGAMGVADG